MAPGTSPYEGHGLGNKVCEVEVKEKYLIEDKTLETGGIHPHFNAVGDHQLPSF
jgi:hypothetical protein